MEAVKVMALTRKSEILFFSKLFSLPFFFPSSLPAILPFFLILFVAEGKEKEGTVTDSSKLLVSP